MALYERLQNNFLLTYRVIMTANEKRCIKSRLVLKLENLGYSVSATDSAEIAVFTDRPVNNTSAKIGNYKHSFLTSFGPVSAQKIICS